MTIIPEYVQNSPDIARYDNNSAIVDQHRLKELNEVMDQYN